jgi:NTP pyrophosphatase (non-canonical NTP hydrolase)
MTTNNEYFLIVVDELAAERRRQIEKWGDHRMMANWSWMPVIIEEIGEVAKAMLQGDLPKVHHELVHVGAVAVAWLEDILEHGDERTDRDFIQG